MSAESGNKSDDFNFLMQTEDKKVCVQFENGIGGEDDR